MSRRVLVYGGRDYADRGAVFRALDAVHGRRGIGVLVHGACPTGADAFAAEWAAARGVEQEPHPADWSTHGRAAGPIRNAAMADSGLDGAVEFPGGRGTADMRRNLERVGVTVWRPVGGAR